MEVETSSLRLGQWTLCEAGDFTHCGLWLYTLIMSLAWLNLSPNITLHTLTSYFIRYAITFMQDNTEETSTLLHPEFNLEGDLFWQIPDSISEFWWSTSNTEQVLFGEKTPSLSCTGLTKQVFLSLAQAVLFHTQCVSWHAGNARRRERAWISQFLTTAPL